MQKGRAGTRLVQEMMQRRNHMGYIYILTNPSFPDYVKIGYADDVATRVKQLNSTAATPYAFRIYATYETETRLIKYYPEIENATVTVEAKKQNQTKGKSEELYMKKLLKIILILKM